MRQVAILLALILSGCDSRTQTSDTVPAPKVESVVPARVSPYQTAADCQNAGGEWKPRCMPGTPRCVMPWSDGGKKCVDPSECESKMCIVDIEERCLPGKECEAVVLPKAGDRAVGICKRDDAYCGSFIEIKGGIAQEIYHAD